MARRTEAPLQGMRVLVTRPQPGASVLSVQLRALGAVPVELPTIRFAPPRDPEPLDRALERLRHRKYRRVIFTSANGVRFVWRRLAELGASEAAARALFQGAKLAAIGPATAGALERRGLHVDHVPDEYVAEAIAEGLGEVAGERILLPRAEVAREALARILERKGAQVDQVPAYRTLPAEVAPAELERIEAMLREGRIDAVTFTSSSTVRHFVGLWKGEVAPLLGEATVACIGPITAGTARELGLPVHVVAEAHTTKGLIRALIERFRGEQAEKLDL